MLQIVIPGRELWDESKQEFTNVKNQTLQLEHSLVSISKWEAKWHKPFITKDERTPEETLDYIKCMTLTQNVDPQVYSCLTKKDYETIRDYIDDPMTATTINEPKKGSGSREIITSELIYYWMIAYNIPPEYQKWHLNRLLTLVKICGIKNESPKKMSKRDVMSRNAALNAARRKQMNTKG